MSAPFNPKPCGFASNLCRFFFDMLYLDNFSKYTLCWCRTSHWESSTPIQCEHYFSTEKCYFYCFQRPFPSLFPTDVGHGLHFLGMFVKVRTLSVCAYTHTHTHAMKLNSIWLLWLGPSSLLVITKSFWREGDRNRLNGKKLPEMWWGIAKMNCQGRIHCSTAVQTALRIWCFQFEGKPKLVSQKRELTYKKTNIYIFCELKSA